jgi:hypothetical protein
MLISDPVMLISDPPIRVFLSDGSWRVDYLGATRTGSLGATRTGSARPAPMRLRRGGSQRTRKLQIRCDGPVRDGLAGQRGAAGSTWRARADWASVPSPDEHATGGMRAADVLETDVEGLRAALASVAVVTLKSGAAGRGPALQLRPSRWIERLWLAVVNDGLATDGIAT